MPHEAMLCSCSNLHHAHKEQERVRGKLLPLCHYEKLSWCIGFYLWCCSDPLTPPWRSGRDTLLWLLVLLPKQTAPF